MNLYNSAKQHFIPAFEVRSVLLMAALALGASGAAQAQGATSGAPSKSGGPAPSSQMAPAEPSGTSAAPAASKASTQEIEVAFKTADADGDGKLSRKEAATFPGLAQRFEQVDTDKDSFVSMKEFTKAAGG
jgi:EF hand